MQIEHKDKLNVSSLNSKHWNYTLGYQLGNLENILTFNFYNLLSFTISRLLFVCFYSQLSLKIEPLWNIFYKFE